MEDVNFPNNGLLNHLGFVEGSIKLIFVTLLMWGKYATFRMATFSRLW